MDSEESDKVVEDERGTGFEDGEEVIGELGQTAVEEDEVWAGIDPRDDIGLMDQDGFKGEPETGRDEKEELGSSLNLSDGDTPAPTVQQELALPPSSPPPQPTTAVVVAPPPPTPTHHIPRLDHLCCLAISAQFYESNILDEIPGHYLPPILSNIDPLTINIRDAAQFITSEPFWAHLSTVYPLADIRHHGSSYKRLYFEMMIRDRLESYHPSSPTPLSRSGSRSGIGATTHTQGNITKQELMTDLDAARPYVHTIKVIELRSHLNLGAILRGFYNLTTVDIVYGAPNLGMAYDPDEFGMKGGDALGLNTLLGETRSISCLMIRESLLDDELISILHKGFMANQTLSAIDLSHNHIGDDGARKLANLLGHQTVLTSLNLADNQIGSDGAKALADAVKGNQTLLELSLRLNPIGGEGGKSLFQGLIGNRTIEEVNCSCCGIEGDEAKTAFINLIRNNESLNRIDISGNDCIGGDGGRGVYDAIKENHQMSHIDIRGNPHLSDQIEQEIGTILYSREERIERTRRMNYLAERG